eukprot:TRINITY_DN29543_c0_g1_i1.p1 TRINITY_DN29543_c0_g1~~TRINITY_DN29543_c0_g1_i1.p1  ORF type:complete len:105 (-),score=15.54 TRINITY_DN29543_c0_g1_i1:71-385(-)
MEKSADMMIASHFLIHYDLRSAWFFLRELGTRKISRPLPSVACNLTIAFLGTDSDGRVSGNLPVCMGALAMLQYSELCLKWDPEISQEWDPEISQDFESSASSS